MADHACLVAGADQLDHRQVETVRGRATVGAQEHPDVRAQPRRQAPIHGRHRPRAGHAQVRVQGEPIAEPRQQMLSVGVVTQHGAAGELGRRVRRHPQFGAAQTLSGERRVETTGQPVDGVTFGHLLIVVMRVSTAVPRLQPRCS